MSYYDSSTPPRPIREQQRNQGRPPRDPGTLPDTSKMSPEAMFEYRKGFILNFGKYKGMSLNEIADEEDDGMQVGLTYLHWLNSVQDENSWPPLREAVQVFVNHPQVKADIEAAMSTQATAKPKGRY